MVSRVSMVRDRVRVRIIRYTVAEFAAADLRYSGHE